MNHLGRLDRLANSYSVMRHGQSKANVRGVIVSRIETDASGDYGLTELGREQVRAAALAWSSPAGARPPTLIFSSDFARAAQSAQIVRAHLGGARRWPSPRPCASAASVTGRGRRPRTTARCGRRTRPGRDRRWRRAGDRGAGPGHARSSRTWKRRHSGRDILLVSHGDTLQILQAGLARMDPAKHRHLPHLETAEIRRLHLAPR